MSSHEVTYRRKDGNEMRKRKWKFKLVRKERKRKNSETVGVFHSSLSLSLHSIFSLTCSFYSSPSSSSWSFFKDRIQTENRNRKFYKMVRLVKVQGEIHLFISLPFLSPFLWLLHFKYEFTHVFPTMKSSLFKVRMGTKLQTPNVGTLCDNLKRRPATDNSI